MPGQFIWRRLFWPQGRLSRSAATGGSISAVAEPPRRLKRYRYDEPDEDDIALAGQIQRCFLPKGFYRFGPFEVAAAVFPAGPVCGDMYDVTLYFGRYVGVWLADATGHGVAAAMLTACIRDKLRRIAWDRRCLRPRSPDRTLAALNRLLLEHQPAEPVFVAAAYLSVDIFDDRISLARGGLPLPALVRRDGSVQRLQCEGRLVGIEPGRAFQTVTLTLEPGDSVVLWSDGLEALGDGSGPGDSWAGRLPGALDLEAVSAGRLHAAVRRIRQAWLAAREDGGVPDDVSVVVVRRAT